MIDAGGGRASDATWRPEMTCAFPGPDSYALLLFVFCSYRRQGRVFQLWSFVNAGVGFFYSPDAPPEATAWPRCVYACVCCKRRRQAGQWSLVGADVFLMDRVSEALQRRWLTTSAALAAS